MSTESSIVNFPDVENGMQEQSWEDIAYQLISRLVQSKSDLDNLPFFIIQRMLAEMSIIVSDDCPYAEANELLWSELTNE